MSSAAWTGVDNNCWPLNHNATDPNKTHGNFDRFVIIKAPHIIFRELH